MNEPGVTPPRIVKWPFFLGDILLLGLSAWLVFGSGGDQWPWTGMLCVVGVAVGAWLAVTPFVLEYRAELALLESGTLAGAIHEIAKVETVARQIQTATSQWQTVHEHAASIAEAARKMREEMAAEAKSFGQFMQRASDTERSHLRLEVDKLKRGEAEWLQVVVRMQDNAFALHQAALRAGQPRVVDQLTTFLHINRDIARRVGLNIYSPEIGDPFDSKVHQAEDPDSAGQEAEVVVDHPLAPGYTFQGQLLRKAVVAVRAKSVANPGEAAALGRSESDTEIFVAAEDQAATPVPSIAAPGVEKVQGELAAESIGESGASVPSLL